MSRDINMMQSSVHIITGHESPEGEYRYSSTLSLTSALDGVGGQRHAPAALPPGKTRCPLHKRLGGPQGRSERVRKILASTGIRSRDRLARKECLYRLRYPGPNMMKNISELTVVLALSMEACNLSYAGWCKTELTRDV